MLTKELLQAVQNHELSVEQAMEQLKDLPYHNMEYAKLDYHRQLRTGFPEVIFAQGKTVAHFRDIFNTLYCFGHTSDKRTSKCDSSYDSPRTVS